MTSETAGAAKNINGVMTVGGPISCCELWCAYVRIADVSQPELEMTRKSNCMAVAGFISILHLDKWRVVY